MKITIKKILLVIPVMMLFFQSCNDFTELNEDPTKWTNVDPNNQLTYVELVSWSNMTPAYTMFAYLSPFVQHFQGEWNASNYGGLYKKNDQVSKLLWDRSYTYAIKNLEDILYKTEGEASWSNVRQLARILRVWYFMILTDTYGDVPYFQGGKGYTQDISMPAYDSQELIYKDFLKELKEAELALNSDGGLITGDIIYNGDIDRWKRFANSLRLRLALRTVYAAPDLAKSTVEEILANPVGLLLSADDDALVKYMEINESSNKEFRRNALAQSWRPTNPNDEPTSQIISSVFFNYMMTTGDPRLLRIARCYANPKNALDPQDRIDITDEVVEQGMDFFLPVDPGFFWYSPWPSKGFDSKLAGVYVRANLRPQINNAFLKGVSPGVFMTYAETQLLMAEVVSRWEDLTPTGASPENYYETGVAAAMNFLLKYGVHAYAGNEIADYLAANPLPWQPEGRLKAINEQLWILHFNNPPEAFANQRRSGYPELKSSREYGAITFQSETIPRRLCYPLEESAYNREAIGVALEKMGGFDDWNAKVWWDKK
ncbi:MAG: SusD/RagB family nutrient-binding outer membrane lipoprotein [Candidatus Symbiothrix sp.]|jgi:hypothetical protein|nr:SusD/RagB family nutrient-binding outer membrane lipoprotein [Candidatus Symbiothrix sp.]